MAHFDINSLNPKIQLFLKNKSLNNSFFDVDKYLNPSIDDLSDPFLLDGMSEAKQRIEKAFDNNDTIVIYGDYDCDGIVASTILYLYFKSRGVTPYVYIPNRFDDGYGLTPGTISEIKEKYNPNLIVTVDLGITAIKETEELKALGIDVIITDHHEMGEGLPDTIVIDPKVPNQKYPFSGLCGAGVALKLVQALGGLSAVQNYLDLASIATIGDIVPLVGENRAISKLGLDMINSGRARKSIQYLLSAIGLKKVTSTDVAFKIVPRINASGRMAEGKIVFEFLVEEDEAKLFELYSKIEADNAERLLEIQKGNAEIEKVMKSYEFKSTPILLVVGDFHQGVLGILASRICHDYNRPTICFTKTEYGTLKGSGRSIDGVDLHELVLELGGLCVRCGGHKMAIGLELEEAKFEEFKEKIIKLASKKYSEDIYKQEFKYSLEISEKDINKKFIDELSILEPFGCENEKPVFMLKANALEAQQMPGKSFKHYRFLTESGKQIVAFNSAKHVSTLSQSGEKQLIVELELNEYKGKFYPQAILKSSKLIAFDFDETRQENMISSLMNMYASTTETRRPDNIMEFNKRSAIEFIKQNTTSSFTHVVVVDNLFDYSYVQDLQKLGYLITNTAPLTKENIVLVRPEGLFDESEVSGYEKVFYLRRCFKHEHSAMAKHMKYVYEPEYITKLSAKLTPSRDVMGLCFVAIKNNLDLLSSSVYEWASKLSQKVKNLSPSELVFALLTFSELGIYSFSVEAGEFKVQKSINFESKQELNNSKLYREVERLTSKIV